MSIQNFIPKIWSARLLEHLDNALVADNFFNRNWEGEIRDHGDTVRINQIGNITIADYVRNQDMTPPQELEGVAQELIIDQAKMYNFQIDDVDDAQTKPKLMNAAMERSAFALADVQDTWLFGLLAAQAQGQLGALAITNPDDAFALLVQMRTMLTAENVPSQGRKVAVPPEMVGMLLRDDRFTATGSGDAEGRLKTGLIGRAVGFDIFEVNTTDNRVIAGHDIGATFASQLIKTEAYRMERRFADGVKGLSVYGARVTIPEAFTVATVSF